MAEGAFLLTFYFSSALCILQTMVVINALFNNETDKTMLLSLKHQIINDPSDVMRSWNDTTYFCNWEGVFCSKKHKGRVVSINISSRGLVGLISSSIENLTFLHYLNLSQNQFSGNIPPSLFGMPSLHVLDLHGNLLHGEIPYNLSSSLTILDLKENNISGSIPSSFGRLSKLSFLSLSRNSLTGKIPLSLGNLSSSLQHLDLCCNQLEGRLPMEIGNCQSLQYLQVSLNNLSGELPPSIFNLSSIYFFGVARNNFEGMIPKNFGDKLINLKVLIVGLNQFKGPIPTSLPNASKLYFIDMSSNNFNGIIPFDLGRLTSLSVLNLGQNNLEANDHSSWRFLDTLSNCLQLKKLFLDSNKLSGILPSSIANISNSLTELSINSNKISGGIPIGILNLINLEILALGFNLFTGAIPKSIGKLAKLQVLDLDRNMLTENIPFSIGNLTQMVYFYLDFNGLKGTIPPSIGNLTNLSGLYFQGNNLNGSIPKELFKPPNILIIRLFLNSLTGPIPLEIGGLKYIRELELDQNRLFGRIPSSISGCVKLELLDLSSNFFQGTIPSFIGDLKELIGLDLSKNNFTGKIPDALGTLRNLQYLNISFNHLVGEVPNEGIFLNTTSLSLQGNYGLCGGVSDLHLLSCPHTSLSKRRRNPLLAILLPIMVAISMIIFSIFFFICRKKKFSKNYSKPKTTEYIYPKVSYAELVSATNGFSPSNLLGIGQYGSVYKGSLDNHGYTIVAVKVFNLKQRGASRSFKLECEALRCIRHRNLVKILTCCVSIDSKGDDFMAIIFEFMPNGNLETWLHHDENMMEHLELSKRLDIAINIADALCYLHYECETPIIHCDMKPSNVLLDADMVAHVGDFGLARLLHGVVSNPLNDSDQNFPVIRGTVGYAPPEYGVGSQVSSMGDVYSYGILILELFTGRRPVDEVFKDGLTLHNLVEMATPDQVMEVIDPNLQLQFLDEDGNAVRSSISIYKCLTSILLLGLSCSKESARERISMADVVVKLHSIRDQAYKAGLKCSTLHI